MTLSRRVRPLVSPAAMIFLALASASADAKTRPTAAKPAAESASPLERAAQALAAFEKQHSDGETAADPALALERAELQLAVLDVSGPDELDTNARRAALEKRVQDVKQRLEQAKRPKPGVKPGDKARITALEARYERARQLWLMLLANEDVATGMGAERVDPELRAFDPSFSAALEKRAAEVKKQLPGLKLQELQGDVSRIGGSVPEALRAGNHQTGAMALQRIDERKLGSANQTLMAACKQLSKGDLLWRLRLAETVVKNAIPRGYSRNVLFGAGSVPDTEKAANEALTLRVLNAAAEVQGQKSCASASALTGLPPEASALGETSFTAQLLARKSAREAAQALPRATGLDQTRDAWQKKLKPLLAPVQKTAAASVAAERKFQAALAQTKTGLVVLDPLTTAEEQARETVLRGEPVVADLAQLRVAEAALGRELTTAAARSAELKAALAVARTDTGKLSTLVTKLGQADGKDPARDAAILAAKANLARAQASLKDATDAAATAERDWGKARTLAELGAAKDLPTRQAKMQAQDDAFKALITDAKQRPKAVEAQRLQALAKGSPAGCNIGTTDFGSIKHPELPDFGDSMGGASANGVDYGDTDGNGTYEAFVYWHGSTSGTAGGDFSQLVVYELDQKCRPRQIGFAEGGLFASGALKGKTYRIDYSVLGPNEPTCCPTGHGFSEFRVVAGKLKQLR